MGAVAVAVRALSVKIRKAFPSGFTLNVDLDFAPGFHILFGASGAGKTTLLDCIAGFTKPEEGKIAVGDRVLLDTAAQIDVSTYQRSIAYVLQSQALFPHLTVRENIAFGIAGREEGFWKAQVAPLVDAIEIAELLDRKPTQLSAGQRQRVALARALAPNPTILLMDEPLAALDAATKAKIVEFLRHWNEQRQIPILYVTHDREEAYALGERLIVLEEGRVVASGPPHDVLTSPERNAIARLAGFENLLECDVVSEHPDQGTMSCRISGTQVVVEAPLTRITGPRLMLGVRAGDILVATERLKGISARNVLQGTIESIEQRGVLVRLFVSVNGAKFEAHVTTGAQLSLGLAGGKSVWLVIKTYSCHLLNK